VIAIRDKDGKQLWVTNIGRNYNPDPNGTYAGERCTPTIDGDRVYALSGLGG
jgi:outer membrane protein assembly factor BamB